MGDSAAPASPHAQVQPAQPDSASATIEALVTQWVGTIHRAAARYGLADSDTEELTQDVRLRLWRVLARPDSPARPISAGYIYRAVVSAAIDLIRRRRKERDRAVPLALVDHLLVDGGASAQDELELMDAIERALQSIPATRRPAVRLHLSGRHLDEIAAVMGWSQAKTRNLLYRGLADLKEKLRGVYAE